MIRAMGSDVVLVQVVEHFLIVGDVVLHVDQIIERIAVLIAAAVEEKVDSAAFVIGGLFEFVTGAGLHGITKL